MCVALRRPLVLVGRSMIVENTHVEIGKNLRRAITLEPFGPHLVNHIAPPWVQRLGSLLALSARSWATRIAHCRPI
jgi:hypothetical protein